MYFPACLISVVLIDKLSPGIFPLTEKSFPALEICDLVLSFISSEPPTATKYQSIPSIHGPALHKIFVSLPAKMTKFLGPLSLYAITSVKTEYKTLTDVTDLLLRFS